MENILPIVIAVFCVAITLIFLVIAYFFPELVGIQGKKAREIEQSHQENNSDKHS